MSRATFASFLILSTAAAALGAGASHAQDAAPSPDAAAAELPAVVVEGATLAKPAAKPRPDAADASPGTGKAKKSTAPSDSAPEAPGDGQPSNAAEETSDGVAGAPLETLGSAVTVVTGEQLAARQIRHAADALRSLPGVEVSRTGGVAGISQVRIRGAEANHTLVIIDGIVANSGTDGEFDFSDLLVEDIARIEVIRGAQSALYGSGAVGGVINFITRGGRGPVTVSGRVEAGAYGTRDVAARVSGGTDRAWGSATVHRKTTDGFNIAPDGALGEDDGSRLTSVSANAGFRPFEGVEVTFNVRNASKEVERDDQTGFGPGSNQGGLIVASDSLSEQDGHVLLLGGQLRWDMFDGALTHIVKANRNVTERNDVTNADFGFGIFPSLFSNTSEVDTAGYQATYRFATPILLSARHSLTGLVEREDQAFTPGPDLGDGVTRERSRVSFAGEWAGEFFDRLDLTAGVRHDDSDTLPDYTTWRSTASLRLEELAIRPHASVGTAVKLPSQFEQFGSAANFVANPNLRAERSFGWDAGVEFTVIKDKAVIDLTYFDANLRDKIKAEFASAFDPGAPFACNPGDFFCSRSINLAGESNRRGIEASGRFAVMPGVSLGLAYTWLDAVDADGLEEKRRPSHSGRADVSYEFDRGRGRLTLAAAYNGDMTDTAFGWPFFFPVVTKTLDEYWVVDVAASYKLSPNVELFGRVENALDEDYQEAFGFETAGIAAYAGLRITFEEASTAHWANYR